MMTAPLLFTGLFLGLLITIKHVFSLLYPEPIKLWMQRFPRSRSWGLVLLFLAILWTFLLVVTTDLGEFSPWRTFILTGAVVGGVLFGWLVPEFLAVRSLGFLLLLAARPLLDLTFLQSGVLPKMLAILAYLWIVLGFIMVGMPYLIRNAFTAVSDPQRQSLWKTLSWIGLLFGLVLLLDAVWLLTN